MKECTLKNRIFERFGLWFSIYYAWSNITAGTTDSDEIINALSNTNREGITGTLCFDNNGNPIKSVEFIKIVDGQGEVISTLSTEDIQSTISNTESVSSEIINNDIESNETSVVIEDYTSYNSTLKEGENNILIQDGQKDEGGYLFTYAYIIDYIDGYTSDLLTKCM